MWKLFILTTPSRKYLPLETIIISRNIRQKKGYFRNVSRFHAQCTLSLLLFGEKKITTKYPLISCKEMSFSFPPIKWWIFFTPIIFLGYFFWQNLHWFYCYFIGKMAPWATRCIVAQMDREFDELASALSDPRKPLVYDSNIQFH